ncbi:hypothetical protein HY837_00945 [archaeon]|nr:hypothetical protein [archaeon]
MPSEPSCLENTIFAKVEEGYWTNYCSKDKKGEFDPNKEGKALGKKLCEENNIEKFIVDEYEKVKCPANCPIKKFGELFGYKPHIDESPQTNFIGPICYEAPLIGSYAECVSHIYFMCLNEDLMKASNLKEPEQPPSVQVISGSSDMKYETIKNKFIKERESSEPSDPEKQFFSAPAPVEVFGASSSEQFGQQATNTGNINNWPEKAQQMCKKAQDNALKECQAAAYHPGGWYVDRAIEAKGTYKGKPINTFVSDQIVGQWDCSQHDLIVNEKGEYIEQAKVYSELIDYNNAMQKTSGGLPPEEQNVEITCRFACTAWPCPMLTSGRGKTSSGGLSTPEPSIPKSSPNCVDKPFTDKDKDGKDDRSGKTKEQIKDLLINGKPTIDGGEYTGFKWVCEGDDNVSWWQFWKKKQCTLGECTTQEIPVKDDPSTTMIRMCCDCSCSQSMIPPTFDPGSYKPLTTDPFEGLFEPKQPLTPPKQESQPVLTMQPKEELTEPIPISCNIIKDKKGSKMFYSFMKGTQLVQKEAPGEPFCDQIIDENKNVISVLVNPACSDKRADMILNQCGTGCDIRNGKSQCLGALMPPSLTEPAPRAHQERPVSHNCCVLYTEINTNYDPRTKKEFFTPKANAEGLTINDGDCGSRERLQGKLGEKEGYYITRSLPACEMRYLQAQVSTPTTPSTPSTSSAVNIPQTPQSTLSIVGNEILSEAPARLYTRNVQAGDHLHVVVNYNQDASGLTTIFIVNGVSASITNIPQVTGSGPTRFSASVGVAQAGVNTVQTIVKDAQGNILASESMTFNIAEQSSQQQNTEQQTEQLTASVVSNIPEGLIFDMFGRIVGEIFRIK